MKKKLTFLIVGLLFVSSLILSACGNNQKDEDQVYTEGKIISAEEARVIAEDFINDFLMMDGTKATVTSKGTAYNLYLLDVDINTDTSIESFISKDGRFFFPQHLDIEEIMSDNPFAMDQELPEVDLIKTDRPVVEMFVMTLCPYGTQIQKGILPVLEVIGNDIDFSQKYVDYAMRDMEEINENLLQYCLEKENFNEFTSYLECFLVNGESETCFNQVVSNPTNINNCITETDEEFKITENYENKVGWRGNFPSFNVHLTEVNRYGIAGSPGLVINGQEVPAYRSPAELLEVICDAFIEKPSACNTPLSEANPSPGFGFDSSGSNTVASCG